MTKQEFRDLRMKLDEYCDDVMKIKGEDYTQDSDDRLVNFKRIAERAGATPLQVWQIFFYKHLDAIDAYCRGGVLSSESITNRFIDARNYLDLGYALIVEQMEEREKSEHLNRRNCMGLDAEGNDLGHSGSGIKYTQAETDVMKYGSFVPKKS